MPNDKMIALDIVLLLPDKIVEHCEEVNDAKSDASSYIRFKDKIFVPHISLFQGYVKVSDKDRLIAELQSAVTCLAHHPLTLEIERISWKAPLMFFYEIKKDASNPALEILQYWIHFMIQKYLPGPGYNPDGSCFADGDTNKFDLDFVNNFSQKYSLENYWPHITLGKSKTDVSQAVTIAPFSADRIGLFQLSTDGTCSLEHQWL